ncbi:MAG: hypothetical protein HRT44_11970 [Bdellovibrionales bacterium]|nr:hypothetical protein [Bdellovibrionales bacterium]
MEARRKQLQLRAFIAALMGFVLLVVLLNLMNTTPEKRKNEAKSQVKFDVKRTKNKNRQKIKKKKKKQARKNKVKSLKPKMDMAFMSGGLDLGVDILGLSAQDSGLLSQAGDTAMTEDVVDQLPEAQ